MELVRSRLLSEGSIWHIGSLSAIYLSQGLSGGTLFALTTYLVSIGSSVTDISLLLSITMIPWTLKVFIGPIIDSFTISRFGRRRFWVLISQLMMILAVLPLVFIEVLEVNWVMISLLTLHNTFVAISDIAIDALAADSLKEDQLAKANGFMWGSKTLGRGLGMALATSVFYAYGVNEGFAILICTMSLILLLPILSKELNRSRSYPLQYESISGLEYVDKIVEISILKVFPSGKEEKKTWLVNPEMPIPPQSTAIHGISNEKVADAPTFKMLAKEINSWIVDADLGGFNSNRFDIPILAEEMLRALARDRDDLRRHRRRELAGGHARRAQGTHHVKPRVVLGRLW